MSDDIFEYHHVRGFQSGVAYERERIIELLEKQICNWHGWGACPDCENLIDTIALIRGKQIV